MKRKKLLVQRYPPSQPCSCNICLGYCARPGWWSVEEAAKAIKAGYANRMMLEVSQELTFGVLSPAFRGCEVAFATNYYAYNGCNFLKDNLCELYGTGYQPLECRYCHHERTGLGDKCHQDIGRSWNTPSGRKLVIMWIKFTGFFEREENKWGLNLIKRSTFRSIVNLDCKSRSYPQ